MTLYEVSVKNDKLHSFNSIHEAYMWVCKNVVNEGDRNWYRECGNTIELEEVTDAKIQQAILNNVVEKVVYAEYNDRGTTETNKYRQYHG